MLTIEKFENLVVKQIGTKKVDMSLVGATGDKLPAWLARLPYLGKQDQYREIKMVLSDLIVADINDGLRMNMLQAMSSTIDRLVVHLQTEYINNPHSPVSEQKVYIEQVKSLYFLLILCHQGIAFRSYEAASIMAGKPDAKHAKSWLDKLSVNVVRNGASFDILSQPKKLFTLSVHQMMNICTKLLMEFALSYQKPPARLWGLMNGWYLKAAILGADRLCVNKLGEIACGSICEEYTQSCLVSFVNLAAYRRSDIVHMFKLLPDWAKDVNATFTPSPDFKIFVNLQGQNPPELITPYASINPYSKGRTCLFFDGSKLLHRLQGLAAQNTSSFETRFAKMVLLSFSHQTEEKGAPVRQQSAELLVGLSAIFKEAANNQSFAQVIAQSQLAENHRPKRTFGTQDTRRETVTLLRKSETGVQFVMKPAQTEQTTEPLSRPHLTVFSLFALKSPSSNNKHPWQLGMVHWAAPTDKDIEVDGRFVGRILSVCGIRLNMRDMRSSDFVQAFLVVDDGPNQQTTLILPRYHFKQGDTVVLRVAEKQTTLVLKQKLLSTDDIEQYQIARLAG